MRMLEVIANVGHREAIIRLAKQHEALDIWTGHEDEEGRQAVRVLIPASRYPALLDDLEGRFTPAVLLALWCLPWMRPSLE